MKEFWIFFIVLQIVHTFTEESSAEDTRNYWEPQTIINKMSIKSLVANRYAKTTVESYVKNPKNQAHQTNFTVVLPKRAFISEFVMRMGGKNYKAFVTGQEEAKDVYQKALKEGHATGYVFARDTNTFMVSVNVEGNSEIEFVLIYEELLERKHNQYELVINIFPGQIVNNLNVEVFINESRSLEFVRTPLIRSGNAIDTKFKENLDPQSDISVKGKNSYITFTATPEQQRMFATELGTGKSQGLAGQFVVEYDARRDRYGGELLIQDNFFVNFLAPDELPSLPKHIVFVLDTSGSMGERIKQSDEDGHKPSKLEELQEAMENILDQLQPSDVFSIIQFSTNPYILDFNRQQKRKIKINNYHRPFDSMNIKDLAAPFSTNMVNDAKKIVNMFVPMGGTNIIAALEAALGTIKLSRILNGSNKKLQPIIMFLTDGTPYGKGITSTDEIVRIITKLNDENEKAPIYTLSFGNGADKTFLTKLSLRNNGYSKHIHDAADASLQLQNFFREISLPILKEIEFEFNNNVVKITRSKFPLLFKGSEIAVCGYYNGTGGPINMVTIKAIGHEGNLTLKPTDVFTPITSLERLCAFLTVQQRLLEYNAFSLKQLKKDALDLALKYSFVTDVTSLIVVKPKPVSRDTNLPDINIRFTNGKIEEGKFAVYNTKYLDDSSDTSTELHAKLPWLAKTLSRNNTLTINQESYLLGEMYQPTLDQNCTNTPMAEYKDGTCRLLRDCSDVWSLLINYNIYQQYFCKVDDIYAGVCCP